MRHSMAAVGMLAVLLLAACGPAVVAPAATTEPGQQASPQPSPAATETPSPVPPASTTATTAPAEAGGSEEADLMRQAAMPAIQDLAARLGVPEEQIMVVDVLEKDWPDASMGCPAPDMAYAQVITPGMQVILEVNGQRYAYHGTLPNNLFLCGPEGPVSPAMETPPQAAAETPMVDVVRADMAQVLGVPQNAIEVMAVEGVEWNTSALGCPQPGQVALDVITPGYRIVLAAGDVTFAYHTDTQGTFVLCQRTP